MRIYTKRDRRVGWKAIAPEKFWELSVISAKFHGCDYNSDPISVGSVAVSRIPQVRRWAILSISLSGVLLLVPLFLLQKNGLTPSAPVNATTIETAPKSPTSTELGPRHQLSYQEWVNILDQEAQVAAHKQPDRLTVLVGDSLSLWFPPDLLPSDRTWLNQGISGETSDGLLRRIDLFDRVKADTILIMIGINDLIRGIAPETVLANQREMIQYLKYAHPNAQIIIQSILPHGGPSVQHRHPEANPPAWVDRLPELPNDVIRDLNRQLVKLAKEEKVGYLNLHPRFTNAQGDLQVSLSSDGLHLSRQGYDVWRSQLAAIGQP